MPTPAPPFPAIETPVEDDAAKAIAAMNDATVEQADASSPEVRRLFHRANTAAKENHFPPDECLMS
jgi:hypothetical protein